jgi:hypothetical protein
MRARCCSILMALVSCALLEGCVEPRGSKWIPPQSVIGFSSVEEIRKAFAHREISTQTSQVHSDDGDFFFVSSYPYSGPRIFNVYCYERIDPDLWRLRAVLVFVSSGTMRVEFQKTAGYVEVVHEGKPLFKIAAAADQEHQDRKGGAQNNP